MKMIPGGGPLTDFLRFLRVGVINILGITVPGVILILFLSGGFLFPLTICVVPFCQEVIGSDICVNWEQAASFWTSNKTLFLFLAVILAYIAGYIIRLSTPDELDKVSAKIVLKKMNDEAEKKEGLSAKDDSWPHQGEPDNRFPYFHFKNYLLSRGESCADLVTWGPPGSPGLSRRSKTHVNMMKLEVMTESPELSAIIESNEAHIRLMFGTWVAIMTTWRLVILGAALSVLALAIGALTSSARSAQASAPCGMSLLLSAAILMAMQWAKVRIEHLFHYQRVRELFHIVACAYYVRLQRQRTNKPMQATSE